MTSLLVWPNRGIPVAALAQRAANASVADIEAHLGPLVFIRHAHARSVDEAMPPMQTGPFQAFTDDAQTTALVLALRRRPESRHPFISIGRLDGNDVTIADGSISKFHAYIKERDGGLWLQDARSRNGTTIDGVPVSGRGTGPPLLLLDGQRIQLGAVEVACTSARRLLELLRRRTAF